MGIIELMITITGSINFELVKTVKHLVAVIGGRQNRGGEGIT